MTGEGVMTTRLTAFGLAAPTVRDYNLKVGSIVRHKGTEDRYEVTDVDPNGDAVCQLIDVIEVSTHA